ncbi:hypothetical protein BGZ82_006304 [Podila clonocystis]|nr:hypothetical protein BGZ82_006304 [Podila clonocystis]
MQRNHHHDNANCSVISRSNTSYTKSGNITPHSPHMPAESSVNSDDIELLTLSVASAKHLPENESFSMPLSPITSSSSLIELWSSCTTPETAQLNGLPSSTFTRLLTTPEPRLLADPLTEGELSQTASQTAPKNIFPMSSAQFRAFLGMAGDKGPKNSKDGETGATMSPAQFQAFLVTSEKENAKASKSMDIKDAKDAREANNNKETEGVEDSKGINDVKSHKDVDSSVAEENGMDAPAELTQTDAESQDRSLTDISTAVSALATQAGHHWDHLCWDELRGPKYYNTDMFKSVLVLQSCHILTKHMMWLENNGPRLFTLLPKPGLNPLLPIERLEYSDFVVQVLCNCVGIKGSKEHCFPHLIADTEFSVFSDGLFTSSITNYLMCVLEALKFGVVMGDAEHVHPMESAETQARIDRAISYLSLWGIETTIQIIE